MSVLVGGGRISRSLDRSHGTVPNPGPVYPTPLPMVGQTPVKTLPSPNFVCGR